MKDFVKELALCPLFAGVQPAETDCMLQCLGYRAEQFAKGAFITLENQQARSIGVVLSGCVDMVKEDFWGNKALVVRLTAGQIFGESFACGSDGLSVAAFCASADSRVLFLPFAKVMHTCGNGCAYHRQLADRMVKVLADKNKELMQKLEVVSQKTLRAKLLAYLSLQAQTRDARSFTIPMNRTDLADYLCADRCALSRELAHMKAEGMLDYHKNHFTLLQ